MVEMRRRDRKMPETFAWNVVDKCEYAFLAMIAEDGTPYGLPLTIVRDGNEIYFHGAKEGRKAVALRKNPKVCLTCVGNTEILQEQFTTRYESAIAFGTASEVTADQEKIEALRKLCCRHTPDGMENFEQEIRTSFTHTAVWKIVVDEITGKAKR